MIGGLLLCGLAGCDADNPNGVTRVSPSPSLQGSVVPPGVPGMPKPVRTVDYVPEAVTSVGPTLPPATARAVATIDAVSTSQAVRAQATASVIGSHRKRCAGCHRCCAGCHEGCEVDRASPYGSHICYQSKGYCLRRGSREERPGNSTSSGGSRYPDGIYRPIGRADACPFRRVRWRRALRAGTHRLIPPPLPV